MDSQTTVLLFGIASATFGFFLLKNDKFAGFVSRTASPGNESKVRYDRKFQGWTGIIVGGFMIALWLFAR